MTESDDLALLAGDNSLPDLAIRSIVRRSSSCRSGRSRRPARGAG